MEERSVDISPKSYIGNQNHLCSFSRPLPCGYFSVTQDREYQDSLEQLKYISKKYVEDIQTVDFDLNKDYEQRIPKPDGTDEKLDHILKFIVTNFQQIRANRRPINADFVCFRGLLRMIMCTPFEDREDWIILAMKYRGTIYLCGQDTEKKKFDNQNMSEQNKKFCSYGFKFEEYLLSSVPNQDGLGGPVKEGEEFCVMFQSTLDGKSLLYGAEMDGANSTAAIKNLDELRNAKFVELKVKQQEFNHKMKRNSAKFKYMKWWCQSFLVGIDDLVVGIRNREGICTETEPLKVSQIPKEVFKIDNNLWKPAECLNFCSDFLQQVKTIMTGIDSDTEVIKFEYLASDQKIIYSKFQDSHSFLPSWYLKFIREAKN